MRDAIRALIRRLAAYAIDVALLAAVLIPLTFAIQAVTGYTATNGLGVWIASILTISVPSWTYFAVADTSASGATLGKRILGLHTRAVGGDRLGPVRALGRTAVKLAPWELTHFAMFGLSEDLGTFTTVQIVLLSSVYVLMAAYLIVALRHAGERSLHDLVAGSAVRRTDPG